MKSNKKVYAADDCYAPLRELNKFADVLYQLVENSPGKEHLKKMDYAGHLGMSPNRVCTYGRMIVRYWFYLKAFAYIHGQMSKEEFYEHRKRFYNLDWQYWDKRRYDAYHKLLLLPKL